MTATVLMVPLVLMTMLVVVQFALAYYARTVASGAAQDGAAAAARYESSEAEGIALTNSLLDQSAGSLIESHSVTASSDGHVITVHVEAEVVSVLPFVGTITVEATGSARVEEFSPQGDRP